MTATTFDLNWIDGLMSELVDRREIFHNERDFQLELAWLLSMKSDVRPRLEFPYPLLKQQNKHPSQNNKKDEEDKKSKRGYMDIWLPSERVAIELKYRTLKLDKKLEIAGDVEFFNLKNQAAQNIARYQFLDDVRRIEELRDKRCDLKVGYAIFLTNDKNYWKSAPESWKGAPQCWEHPPDICDNKDAQFHLHDGRVIKGTLDWTRGRGEGCAKDRPPFTLTGCYKANWQSYRNFQNDDNGLFKYLAFQVSGPESERGKL